MPSCSDTGSRDDILIDEGVLVISFGYYQWELSLFYFVSFVVVVEGLCASVSCDFNDIWAFNVCFLQLADCCFLAMWFVNFFSVSSREVPVSIAFIMLLVAFFFSRANFSCRSTFDFVWHQSFHCVDLFSFSGSLSSILLSISFTSLQIFQKFRKSCSLLCLVFFSEILSCSIVVSSETVWSGEKKHWANFLPHFDVLCDLLLNRRTATWNLFVKYNLFYLWGFLSLLTLQ